MYVVCDSHGRCERLIHAGSRSWRGWTSILAGRLLLQIFVRENSEGEYAGSGSWLFKGVENEVVIQNGVFSRKGCERVIRYAYELARRGVR